MAKNEIRYNRVCRFELRPLKAKDEISFSVRSTIVNFAARDTLPGGSDRARDVLNLPTLVDCYR